MSGALQGDGVTYVTPWERGRAASFLRPKVDELLRPSILAWALKREHALCDIGAPQAGLFEEDAQALVREPFCVQTISAFPGSCPGVSEADAEAAILSLLVAVLWKHRGGLLSLYVLSAADRLRGLLRLPLKMVRLDARALQDPQEILVPMALFFLDSLRMCAADPNCFRLESTSERTFAVRPFGWSPAHDKLDTFLSLLTARQAGRSFRSRAFMCSPLAYYLRSAGLAAMVEEEQAVCEDCGKSFHARALAGKCPECGGRVQSRQFKRLLSTRYVEGVLRDVATGEESLPPSQTALARTAQEVIAARRELDSGRNRQTELDGLMQTALGHALELWNDTVQRRRCSPCALAVLFFLAGLENVPTPTETRHPSPSWIWQIVANLLEKPLPRNPVMRWAEAHMQDIFRTCGDSGATRLTTSNVGRIAFRFRKRIFRDE